MTGDPRLGGEVGEADAAAGGQRVVAREHEVQRVLEQVDALDVVARLGGSRLDDDRQVQLAAAQERHAVLALGQAQGELDGRVLPAEGGDGQGHERRADGLEGGHPQAAAAQAGDRLQLGLRLGQAGHDRLGVAHERLARLGEAHAARAALHEDRAGLALERRDLLRDRRLRERQRLGRGGERAAHRDLAQDPETAYVEHHLSLYHFARNVI